MTGSTYHSQKKHSGQQTQSPSQQKGTLSWLLDDCITLPGGYRIGLDGIIGLVPGIGDITSSGISSWLLFKAYKQGVPNLIIVRMLINIVIDTIVGLIPVVGDLFDFIWKANARNAILLDEYRAAPDTTYRRSASAIGVFSLILVAVIMLSIFIVYTTVKLLIGLF